MIKRKIKVNDYAKSMFFFETLNDRWIINCVKYLKKIFGDKIKDANIVDYAFGRGNWSIAFHKLGAKKVIAIDKSLHNVIKLKTYLKKNNIKNVKVLHGDVVTATFEDTIDIYWIYGIFHHLKNINKFIYTIEKSWQNKNAIGLIYAYEKNSIRNYIINFARKYLAFNSYEDFLKNSYYFNHFSRLRARDDIVVDHIKWYSEKEIVKILNKGKFYPIKRLASFEKFNGLQNFEFNPHHLIFSKKKSKNFRIIRQNKDHNIELLNNLLKLITKKIKNQKTLQKISYGLLNTHFNGDNSEYHKNFYKIIIFLYFVIKQNKISSKDKNLNYFINQLDEIRLGNKSHYKFNKKYNNLLKYISKTSLRI